MICGFDPKTVYVESGTNSVDIYYYFLSSESIQQLLAFASFLPFPTQDTKFDL